MEKASERKETACKLKVFLKDNVYEAALKRIERIFNEFDHVIVSVSGGKDSTAVMELALEVARKMNRLPLDVMFIDQEAEWQHTIDYMSEVMHRKEIRPHWLQVPIKETNASNHTDQYLYCWDEKAKAKWMREKDPIAIHENIFGTDRFHKMFPAFCSYLFNGEPYANLGGVRTEESPMRFGGITGARCYKDITWGKKEPKGCTFYPIYDWTFDDVLCNRLDGVSTFSQLQDDVVVSEYPADFFSGWKEYRDYLLENLIEPEIQDVFRKRWKGQDSEKWYKEHVQEILVNDTEGTKNGNFLSRQNLVRKINNGVYEKKYDYKEGESEE